MARKRKVAAESPMAYRPPSMVHLEGQHANVPQPGKKVMLVIEGTVKHAAADDHGGRSASIEVKKVRPGGDAMKRGHGGSVKAATKGKGGKIPPEPKTGTPPFAHRKKRKKV